MGLTLPTHYPEGCGRIVKRQVRLFYSPTGACATRMFSMTWSLSSYASPQTTAMNRIARASFSQSQLVQKSTVFPSRLRGYGCSIVPVSQILQNHVKLSPNKRSFFGFCSCSLNEDLSNKKCVPCESKDIRPMLEQSAQELLPKIPGWSLVNEDGKLKLQRSWKVKTFTKGLEFFHAVADLAEAEGHHPDLHLVGWNNVKIEIWTHSVGGLTENDFILAAKINSLDLQHLLRRKPAA